MVAVAKSGTTELGAARRRYDAWIEELARETDAVRRTGAFRSWFETAARCWRYSPFNQLLIVAQYPGAHRVAGRRAWERAGRRVREGAKPIYIFAYTGSTGRGSPFVAVEVFDVEQTEGEPVAELDLDLAGRAPMLRRVERAARVLGIRIATVRRGDGWKGRSLGGRVELLKDLAPAERLATLIHELAHEVLHERRDRIALPMARAWREAEAEGVAFVVARALGLGSLAPNYLAWQGVTGAVVRRFLKRINAGVRSILLAVEGTAWRPKLKPLLKTALEPPTAPQAET